MFSAYARMVRTQRRRTAGHMRGDANRARFSSFLSLEVLEDRTLLAAALVKDINPGPNGSYPGGVWNPLPPNDFRTESVDVNGVLYFVANNGGTNYELWRSNGTSTGTYQVADINPGSDGSYPQNLINVNGQLLFMAKSAGSNYELWRSDGTAAGTTLVEDIWPGANGAYPMRVPDPLTAVYRTETALMNGVLYFPANSGGTNYELWRSDGTAAGTYQLADINAGSDGSYPQNLINVNGQLLFMAKNADNDYELWRSDGTPAGTALVKDIQPGANGSYPMRVPDPLTGDFRTEMVPINGVLYFPANDGGTNYELWRSDGTLSGTYQVNDVNPESDGSYPQNLVNLNGLLLFMAKNGGTDYELWRSNGTAAGTALVEDIRVGASSSYPGRVMDPLSGLYRSDWAVMNGNLFFPATDGLSNTELWRSDGTEAGTSVVTEIWPDNYYGSNPQNLTVMGNTLFFSANNGLSEGNYELWRSDGTMAGTWNVKDIWPGFAGSYAGWVPDPVAGGYRPEIAVMNGRLYFPATDGSPVNYELWQSNGTAAGTFKVQEIQAGLNGSFPQRFRRVGGTLYFMANDAAANYELWRTVGWAIPQVTAATIVGLAPAPGLDLLPVGISFDSVGSHEPAQMRGTRPACDNEGDDVGGDKPDHISFIARTVATNSTTKTSENWFTCDINDISWNTNDDTLMRF